MRYSRDIIDAVRARYAAGEPVAAIRASTGMSRRTLYYWLDGGPANGPERLAPLPRRNRVVARSSPRAEKARAGAVARLWRAAEAQVQRIEERLQVDDGAAATGAAEDERDARMLAVLARTLRELVAMDTARRDSRPKATADHDDFPVDTDTLRRRLSEKLARIIAERDAKVSDRS